MRDAREDRLVLLYSTSSNLRKCQANANEVKDPGHYFDGDQRCYFYPLYDRLAEPRERNSQFGPGEPWVNGLGGINWALSCSQRQVWQARVGHPG